MCGIFAVWSASGRVEQAELKPIEGLRHRGPDALYRWTAPSGRAGLALTRLAVVGIRNGDQPVRDESGTVHAVVNGEFYGYRELRRELAERGVTLRTDADSELAAHYYTLDPSGFVHRLRGEFALVLWDERRGTLLALRDRFGIKPLFYTWAGDRLVLASELRALFAAGTPARWDAESFHDYLNACFGPDRTLFEGVYQVPPGCLLRVDDGGARVEPYWRIDFPLIGAEAQPYPRTVELVREQIEEAVRLRLIADVPVGFQLSGGLDSSSVAGAAAGNVPLLTYTVRFPGSELDEGHVAARTAAALGAEHHEVVLEPRTRAQLAVEAVAAGGMLQENDHGTARLALSAAMSAAGLRVALSGEGGDELFGGYGHFRTDAALCSAQRLAAARRAQAKLAAGPVPATVTGAFERLGFVPGWLLERCMNTALPAAPLLNDGFRRRFARRDALATMIEAEHARLAGRAPVHQSTLLFLRSWFCNYILAAERLDMAKSLEVRLPLLDHRLFALVSAIPATQLHRDLVKSLLRDAMRPRLTDEVAHGRKRPFFAPPAKDARAWTAHVRRRIDDGALDGFGFFDSKAVMGLLCRLEQAPGPLSPVQDRMLHLIHSVSVLHQTYRMAA